MDKTISAILEIIKDYHNYNGFQFTDKHILSWVNQFEEKDREFILEEFLHLLSNNIYISESMARSLLLNRIEFLAKKFKYANVPSFLANVELLRPQPTDKSQDVLLKLLDEEIQNAYGIDLTACGTSSLKYVIYVDDILATGGTVFKDISKWLSETTSDGYTNLNKVVKNEKVLIVSLFCIHTSNTMIWRLKLEIKNDDILKKVNIFSDYEIQNHPKFLNQRFNLAFPISRQPQIVQDYLDSLSAMSRENQAFRKEEAPANENFFSSPENRVRFENILLHKGIELLSKTATLKPNHRPLGATFPSYKTLGTGTLFFTWRNISNTTPIVFWWEASGWHPFFPLFRRGLGGTTFAL